MNNILTVIRKEFARFFRDKRLVLGTLILPGVLIFLLYTLMGSVFFDSEQTYTVKVVNPSQMFAEMFEPSEDGEESPIVLENVEASEIDSIKAEIKAGEVDALVVLPENFDEIIQDILESILTGGFVPVQDAPNIEIWYDSAHTSSVSAYSTISTALDVFEDKVSNIYDVNVSAGGNLSTSEEATANYYATLLPFLILTFLYSGCMGVAPESIAGEKERGTIATLLVTPIKRSQLVIGKIVSLSAISALSAISSFIGTFLSMPKLMGGSIGDMLASYSVGSYFALFGVMLSAVLLIVSLISILSALAKSVKEATTFSVPLMIVVMLVGLSSMMFTTSSVGACFIPVFNCVQVMAGIFSLHFSAVNFAVTMAANAVYIVLLVWALTKMFESERVVFGK